MNTRDTQSLMDRRDFIKLLAASALKASAIGCASSLKDANTAKTAVLDRRHEISSMAYRKLGRTNFMSSRIVFGCGAALAGGKAVRLLERTFEAGINHYDVGSDIFYKGAEQSLAPFLKKYRDKVWVASKAPVFIPLKPGDIVKVDEAGVAAQKWTKLMESSLKDLDTDYIDAYYIMMVNNPSLVRSEEMYNAFQKAKAAGKVGHFGISTHANTFKVLQAAIETGWYDVAMIGITPVGWYDWDTRNIQEGSPTLVELEPFLKRARTSGIGLIGMKAARCLAPMSSLGRGDTTAFDKVYSEKFKVSPLNPFQRAYAYVLEHGIDVINADMQNFKHLEENILAASTSHQHCC